MHPEHFQTAVFYEIIPRSCAGTAGAEWLAAMGRWHQPNLLTRMSWEDRQVQYQHGYWDLPYKNGPQLLTRWTLALCLKTAIAMLGR